MKLSACSSCPEGLLIQKRKEVLFTYQGQQYYIPDVVVYVCNTCDEEIIEAQEIRRMEAIAKQKQQSPLQVNLVKEIGLH